MRIGRDSKINLKVGNRLEFAKFRKRPVEIEAALLDRTVEIETLEGVITGNPGDYLVVGVEGEVYPCKPSIFEKTYEKV